MVFNALIMLILNAVLGLAAVGLIGISGNGVLSGVGESSALTAILYMLVAWLAGILCFLGGTQLKVLENKLQTLLSAGIWTVLGWLLALVFPAAAIALALPYAPIPFVFTGTMLWPAFGFLSVLTPLLALAAMQIRRGKKGEKGLAYGIILGYIVLLMLLPIIAVVKSVF